MCLLVFPIVLFVTYINLVWGIILCELSAFFGKVVLFRGRLLALARHKLAFLYSVGLQPHSTWYYLVRTSRCQATGPCSPVLTVFQVAQFNATMQALSIFSWKWLWNHSWRWFGTERWPLPYSNLKEDSQINHLPPQAVIIEHHMQLYSKRLIWIHFANTRGPFYKSPCQYAPWWTELTEVSTHPRSSIG